MQMRSILALIFFFVSASLLSQTEKISEGFSEVEMLENMTPEQTKLKALELAKINAIENAFGQLVMEGSTLYTVNKQTGTKVEFNQVFNSISGISVNGEWIKDINNPQIERILKENERIFYSVKVKGVVRELKKAIAQFTARTSSCLDKKCFTEQFTNGQDLFLYFKSAKKGDLAVYLDDPVAGKTYLMFPYKKYAGQGSMKIEADKEYFFFSEKNNAIPELKAVDEFQLSLTNENIAETNTLYILFSSGQEFGKPLLENLNSPNLPPSLNSKDFQSWLQESRTRNKDIELSVEYISIKPSN